MAQNIFARMAHSLGGPWDFNQIIGYLRLFTEGWGVGGHIWLAEGQRYSRRMPNKTLYLRTYSNVLGTYLPREATSPEIYKHVLENIEAYARSHARRFYDLSVFKRIGPCIDWAGMHRDGMEFNERAYASAKQHVANASAGCGE